MPWHVLILSFVVTWLTEWAAAAVMLRRSTVALAYGVFLVNALTQPLAVASYWELDYDFWLIEIMVVLVEIPLYQLVLRVSWLQAALISLIGNGLSAATSFFW